MERIFGTGGDEESISRKSRGSTGHVGFMVGGKPLKVNNKNLEKINKIFEDVEMEFSSGSALTSKAF